MQLPFDPSTIRYFVAAMSVDRKRVFHYIGLPSEPTELDVEQFKVELLHDDDLKINEPYIVEVIEDEDIKEVLVDVMMENIHQAVRVDTH